GNVCGFAKRQKVNSAGAIIATLSESIVVASGCLQRIDPIASLLSRENAIYRIGTLRYGPPHSDASSARSAVP
ncbi:MAG TPA: hypothetical protein PLY87_25000, partial [Planctomycetaceae bacterium]|nr:hypothetical protein [Planctomycetaceae bacterium]